MSGNYFAFGHYDQCLKFSHNHSWTVPFVSKTIKGQHCNVALSLKPASRTIKFRLEKDENPEERALTGVTE